MLDFIMANPGCTYEQISAAIGGYSIGWISQIYNSDAFQALMNERQVEVFGDIKLTIKDRVVGVGHAALKRLEERLPVETDLDKVANVADLALKSMGFGAKSPSAPPGGQTNIFVGQVDPATLAAARQLMHKPASLPSAEKLVEGQEVSAEDIGAQPA